ncbi:nucleotidyltransferase domain-containing protein [Curtobacterium sp. ISL-83]|uniref:nucleotidyltransferase domain-containing protein n=1 Tax=Curtobacterium sp. ISL-83 TaxID=2819145 RepID=UPI001BE53CDA|nr:nucleotidyltransferase domain-containing protein [Curtobacterium sp. ISL-83]MBT2503608.1 nucleotidyltransferase domain-containing protein [Curtobacterium sp. ISL-83]
MQLAQPLATLLGSTQADALRVLARTDTGMTGRQVARVAGANQHTGIKRALDKLEQVGLVCVERGLQHSSYRANREHVLWPAVELGLGAGNELERRIAEFVQREDLDVLSASLFGSVARGDATETSDVDLLVVFAEAVDVDAVTQLGELVERWTGNECQVFDVTRADLLRFVREGDPLVGSWREEARTVYGSDIRTLL